MNGQNLSTAQNQRLENCPQWRSMGMMTGGKRQLCIFAHCFHTIVVLKPRWLAHFFRWRGTIDSLCLCSSSSHSVNVIHRPFFFRWWFSLLISLIISQLKKIKEGKTSYKVPLLFLYSSKRSKRKLSIISMVLAWLAGCWGLKKSFIRNGFQHQQLDFVGSARGETRKESSTKRKQKWRFYLLTITICSSLIFTESDTSKNCLILRYDQNHRGNVFINAI